MTRKELSLLYSPDCTPDAARHRLTRWIAGDPDLLNDLHQAGYKDTQRTLTPKQVNIIYSYLGTPQEFAEAA